MVTIRRFWFCTGACLSRLGLDCRNHFQPPSAPLRFPPHYDITWIKHEFAERHHELKYGSGYSEAHDRAQSRYDGHPWSKRF